MRALLRYILLAIVGLMSSCDFDHLHYETHMLAMVRIDVDWDRSHITPNGITTYVYDSNGDLYSESLSSNINVVYLKLPVGLYTVVLHNNSISELGGVELRDMKRLESASIYAKTRSDSPSFDAVGEDQLFVEEPDDVVSCTLRGVEVTASDIEYHYYKPDLEDYEQEFVEVYSAEPLHIVHISRVIAHIGGLEYVSGTPMAILRGMSGGYNFGMESTTDGDVMEEFEVSVNITKAESTAEDEDGDGDGDTIYIDYNTFGMHANDPEDQLYYMDIRFPLLDGSYKDYHMDVTDDIRTATTETQNIHIIEMELDPLPEVEPEDKPDGGDDDDMFDPSLDEWVGVDVELPM